MNRSPLARRSIFRRMIESESGGGIVLMGAATLGLVIANSPLADDYFSALRAHLGPLSVAHWINDGLMAVFFLLVGLEIKREMLQGQLSTWRRRILPGVAALGGMVVPALIFVVLNRSSPQTLRGWAIPTATDIAFALGVVSLLGSRVPASLKVFLTALAIIDDLGAVLVIAIFYTEGLSLEYLGGAAGVLLLLTVLNRMGVRSLVPYSALGLLLWLFVLKSGIHATLAGVALALTIPLGPHKSGLGEETAPLIRMENALHKVVGFFVVPLFGFANAGVSFAGMSFGVLLEPVTIGVALGLLAGKLVGVFGAVSILVKLGFADVPANAAWAHVLGIALLCGIGFTMSLFIGLLAFPTRPDLQVEVKIGILLGSLLSALAGTGVMIMAPSPGSAATRY